METPHTYGSLPAGGLFITRIALALLLAVTVLSAAPAEAADARPLVVGIDRDYAPFAFVDSQGHPAGYDVELMLLIGQRIGREVEFRPNDWTAVVASLERGEVDLVTGMLYTETRSRVFDFSLPFNIDTVVIFVRKGSSVRDYRDLDGKNIAMLRGDALVESFIKTNGLKVHLDYFPTHPDALRALNEGRHDLSIAPYQVGMEAIRIHGLANLTDTGPVINSMPYRIGARKGRAELIARIDEAIGEILSSIENARLKSKWFRHRREEFTWQTILRYMLPIMLPVVFLMLFTWVYFLRKTVRSQTAEIMKYHDRLVYQATIDSLTGIFNRRHWFAGSEKEFAKALRKGTPLTVLMIDIDDFKSVNDSLGHAAGDAVLQRIASVVPTCLRSYDLLGRYGGEEFVALLPDTSLDQGCRIAERIRTSVAEDEIDTGGREVRCTVSVGVAEMASLDDSLYSLIKRADAALYEAKRQGKNRICRSAD